MNFATALAPWPAFLVGLGLAVAGAGCGGANIPANPTWAHDVRPILVARCIHCHYATQPGEPPLDAANLDYPDFDSALAAGAVDILKLDGLIQIRLGRMPKPPSTPLEDWQIETLTRWAKNPQ